MTDFVDLIFFHAEATPDKPAVITKEAILTYAMLRQGILSAQERLAFHGLNAGDRVAITTPNVIGHMGLICAAHRAGIVSVSIDATQLDSIDDLDLDAVLTTDPIPNARVKTIAIDESWFNAKAPAHPPRYQPEDGALCRLILSSGTTGRPKIIGLTFGAVKERLISYSIRVSTPSWDRMVCIPGISTNYGYSFAVTALWLGRTILFAYDVTARQMILAHQADLMIASTQQITTIVQEQEQAFLRLDSLRAVHIGGSIAYVPLLTRIRMLVCSNLFCGYGSTEGGTVAYAPVEAVYGMERAVGITAPWVDLEVTGDQGKTEDYGQLGEVRIRSLGQGYRYTKTDSGAYELDEAEWFHPGDQGVVYRNGMLVITGRLNEIINRGGVKVAPDMIEEEIKKNPGVADAAAVGILDPVGIEQIWLAVVQRDGGAFDVKAMFEFCHSAIPNYVPDRIFAVAEIPRNKLGKVSRETLKEQLKALEESHVLSVR